MLKPGKKLKSAVCDAEVMIIKAAGEGELTCGGAPMGEAPQKQAPVGDSMHGCLIGKRYVNEAQTVEVLCVKSGEGALFFDGEELMTKDTKKLPSSD